MNRRYLMAATFLSIGACVTSGPELPAPAANAESSMTNSNSTAAADELKVAEVPEVPSLANIPIRQPDRICRKERRTGSFFLKRVCRTPREIEEARQTGQGMLKELGMRSNSGFQSR